MEAIRSALDPLLPGPIRGWAPVAGGDIGQSFRVQTREGPVFVKAYTGGSAGAMVDAEARGLAWLAQAGALRVPQVVARSSASQDSLALIVLEWVEVGASGPETEEAFGRGLAALHDAGAPVFGFETDNFIGRLPQHNAPCESWADFYRERRLLPLIERAREHALLSPLLDALATRLIERLPGLVPAGEPAARLHGDLWGGNWLCGAGGEPVLIDPAAYGGHREVDLAMMQLFGGFSSRVFAAYAESTQLLPDWQDRVPLYQLYPLLVHLNLFGASYAGGVERALRACL